MPRTLHLYCAGPSSMSEKEIMRFGHGEEHPKHETGQALLAGNRLPSSVHFGINHLAWETPCPGLPT